MNLNPDKCHLPLNINDQNTLNTGNLHIKDSLCGKVHGIANHIEAKKYWRNIWRHWKRILMNAFFKPQFNYCPFIWTCCNHSLISKINRLHDVCELCTAIKFWETSRRSWFCLYSSSKYQISKVWEMFKEKIFHFRDAVTCQLRKRRFSNPIYTLCFQWDRGYKNSRTKNLGNFA